MTTGPPAESDAITSSGHCPHCGALLPEPAKSEPALSASAAAGDVVHFCPSCGRRVEGWRTGFRAKVGGAGVGAELPGSEEPTRAIAPSPSLLRAVSASKAASVSPGGASRAAAAGEAPATNPEVDLPAVQASRLPLVLGVLGVLLVGGAVAALLLTRAGHVEPATAPFVVDNKPVAEPTPASVVASAPTKKAGKARRISAPPIAAGASAPPQSRPAPTKSTAPSTGPSPRAGKPAAQTGALPHKDSTKTDSKATDVSAMPPGAGSSGTGSSGAPSGEMPMAPNETVEGEATPMNEAERRAENAARADADGVRFVVRAHLPQVQACYARAFKESSPGGRVDVGFVINASGKPTKIRTESNTTSAPALARCLEQRIGEWEFPRPASGEFELIYPFVFSPGS